ncbi:MAG: hypothetical protein HY716_07685 [Planctomycetes bacterium]|nr:hypothetical protein [Planctomycetota bacterium]
MARIASTAVALPEHRITQEEAREACRHLFRGNGRLEALLDVFGHAGVETRYFAFPLEYYLEERSFARRNRDYIEQATRLGSRAIRQALDRADCRVQDIDQIYWVTTTGVSTPSVDALVAVELGFRPDCQRNPLFGIGCAGGAAALSRAAQAVSGRQKALIVSVELCGQTFRIQDRTATNLIGTALFGDGAAAAVVEAGSRGPEIVAWGSELFEGTRDVMGWDFLDGGFQLILSPSVPLVIVERAIPAIRRFLERLGLAPSDIRHLVLHPGGARVIEAYASALEGADLHWIRDSLRRVGNVSSAAVLFVLHDVLESGTTRPGDRGLVAAVGPGFAMEAVLLRWSST